LWPTYWYTRTRLLVVINPYYKLLFFSLQDRFHTWISIVTTTSYRIQHFTKRCPHGSDVNAADNCDNFYLVASWTPVSWHRWRHFLSAWHLPPTVSNIRCCAVLTVVLQVENGSSKCQ